MSFVHQHPLGERLDKIFNKLAQEDTAAGGESDLNALVESESDYLLHRGNPVNGTSRALSQYISVRMYFLSRCCMAGALAAIEALFNVHFVDVDTKAVIFSQVLSVVVMAQQPVISERAAVLWGKVLSNFPDCSCLKKIADRQLQLIEEWMRDPHTSYLYAGCLFTVQIRKHRSGILIPRLPMILAGL